MKPTIVRLVLLGLAALVYDVCPAVAAQTGRQVFRVADYGAHPNTTSDSGPGIRKAIAAAIATGKPADVEFDNGAYRVAPISSGTWWGKEAISVLGAKDLVLRGSIKTAIIVTDPNSAGIDLRNCEKVAAQRLTIDYDPVPQVLSKVVAIDPDHKFIEVEQQPCDRDLMTFADPCFLDSKAPFMTTTYRFLKDGKPMWGYEPVGLTVGERTGPNRWKLMPKQFSTILSDAISVAGLRVGDLLVSSVSHDGGAAFSMIDNKSAQARQITIHASPGLAFFPHENDSVSLIGCVIEIKPGSHRVLASTADGIHARGNRHIDIEDCSIEGTGDDAMNLHSEAAIPIERLSPASFVFKRNMYTVRSSDTFEQLRPDTGLIIGRYVVKNVDSSPKDGWHVEFTDRVPDVVIGKDLFFNLNEGNNDFIVRNNLFGTHRGRDLLIQANKGVVEHNRFANRRTILLPRIVSSNPGFDRAMENLCGVCIQIAFESNFPGGPITQGVTIRDNVFEGNDFRSPAIWISALRSCRDIAIEHNTFKNRNTSVVVASSVTNLIIKDNKVSGRGARMSATPVVPAFDLRQCVNPIASDNIVDSGLFTEQAGLRQ